MPRCISAVRKIFKVMEGIRNSFYINITIRAGLLFSIILYFVLLFFKKNRRLQRRLCRQLKLKISMSILLTTGLDTASFKSNLFIMEPDIRNSIITKMRDKLKTIDPHRLSKNTGAAFDTTDENRGEFQLAFFGESFTITCPDFIIRNSDSNEEVQEHIQALILYYFVTADGTPPGICSCTSSLLSESLITKSG